MTTQSTTETEEPMRGIPHTENFEPKRATDRKDKDEPI